MTLRDRLCCWPAFWQLIFMAVPAIGVCIGWAGAYVGDSFNRASKASREALEW